MLLRRPARPPASGAGESGAQREFVVTWPTNLRSPLRTRRAARTHLRSCPRDHPRSVLRPDDAGGPRGDAEPCTMHARTHHQRPPQPPPAAALHQALNRDSLLHTVPYRPTEKTEARRAATRERIVAAALDQLADGGYASRVRPGGRRPRAESPPAPSTGISPPNRTLFAEAFRRASARELDVLAEIAGRRRPARPRADRRRRRGVRPPRARRADPRLRAARRAGRSGRRGRAPHLPPRLPRRASPRPSSRASRPASSRRRTPRPSPPRWSARSARRSSARSPRERPRDATRP